MSIVRVVSQDGIKAERMQKRASGLLTPLQRSEWPSGINTVQELVVTTDVSDYFVNKLEIDVSLGLDDVPLLYPEIYTTRTDPNFGQYVGTNVANPRWGIRFVQHVEAGEVIFGTLRTGAKGVVELIRDAAGIAYTRDMIDFNLLSQIEDVNVEFGRAWNAKRNHMTLYPIISNSYPGGNLTAADATAATYALRVRKTIELGYVASVNAKRPATIILCNSVDSRDIQYALSMRTDTLDQPLAPMGNFVIVEYDGWDTILDYGAASKTYSYGGVPSKSAFMIRPFAGFRYLVKKDLTFLRGDGDLSRLIEREIVGYGIHGLLADPSGNVQKITIPSS